MNSLKEYYKELILVTVLCVALVFATDSLPGIYMPNTFTMTMLVIFVVLLAGFLVFIWKAKPQDEREGIHDWYSGRLAYTLGIIVLAIGSIIQALQHNVDPWLATTLVVMVIGKVVAKIFLSARY